MGMFDKDKLFARDGAMKDWVNLDTPFILRGAELKGRVQTPNGPSDDTPIVWLYVCPIDSPEKEPDIVSMVGDNIAEKVSQMEDGDLPCVCVTKQVPSSIESGQDAYVLNWYSDDVPGGKGKK